MKHRISLRSKIARLTVLLAGVVAFCTAWALILPAITITDDVATQDEGFYMEEGQAPQTAGAGEADEQTTSAKAPVPATPETAPTPAGEAAPEEAPVDGYSEGIQTDSPAAAESGAPNTAETDSHTVEAAMPQQDLTEKADMGDGQVLEVRIESKEGVLPEGTTLHLDKELKDDHIGLMRAKAEEKVGIQKDSSLVLGADIAFEDADGAIVEPQGKVLVTLSFSVIEPDVSFFVCHRARGRSRRPRRRGQSRCRDSEEVGPRAEPRAVRGDGLLSVRHRLHPRARR